MNQSEGTYKTTILNNTIKYNLAKADPSPGLAKCLYIHIFVFTFVLFCFGLGVGSNGVGFLLLPVFIYMLLTWHQLFFRINL